MNEPGLQHFHLYKLKNRQKILTTRTKMRVLSSLNSDYMKHMCNEVVQEPKSEEVAPDYEKIFLQFFQDEELYIKDLKCLYEFLLHPLLRRTVVSLADIIEYVSEITSAHECLYKELSSQEYPLAVSFRIILPLLRKYVKYHTEIELEIANFQKFCDHEEKQWDYFQKLLLKPMSQILRYETLFKDLSRTLPLESGYEDICTAIQCALKEIDQIAFTRKNSLKIYQIQKRLVDGQPKILVYGRKFLKEGLLYKVNNNGKQLRPRMFFLFNDILMCCKVKGKMLNQHTLPNLKCSSLIPLNLSSVKFVLGHSTGEAALFKVTCEDFFYLLLSKVPGESQSWVKELQLAINQCQANLNIRHRERSGHIHLKRTFGIRNAHQPLITKRSGMKETSASNIKSVQENENMSTKLKHHASTNKIFKWCVCLR